MFLYHPSSPRSYEMCMMASMRGYCECNMAGLELESPTSVGDDPSKKALARLKSAASIFSCIATQLLPLKESLPVIRAPEVVPAYHRALEQMCRYTCMPFAALPFHWVDTLCHLSMPVADLVVSQRFMPAAGNQPGYPARHGRVPGRQTLFGGRPDLRGFPPNPHIPQKRLE